MFDIKEDNQVESLQELVADYDGIIHKQTAALHEKDERIRELEKRIMENPALHRFDGRSGGYWYAQSKSLKDEIDGLRAYATGKAQENDQLHNRIVETNHKLDHMNQCLGEWSVTALPRLKKASELIPSLTMVLNFVAKIHEGWTTPDGESPWK
jgi:uncharacterized coiled-coil DUF342 family protein